MGNNSQIECDRGRWSCDWNSHSKNWGGCETRKLVCCFILYIFDLYTWEISEKFSLKGWLSHVSDVMTINFQCPSSRYLAFVRNSNAYIHFRLLFMFHQTLNIWELRFKTAIRQRDGDAEGGYDSSLGQWILMIYPSLHVLGKKLSFKLTVQ